MNKLLAALPLIAACEEGPDKASDTADSTVSATCDLSVNAPACTDPCPAIATSDELIDLRTSTLVRILNVGEAACDASAAELSLDWVDEFGVPLWSESLSTQEVRATTPGETTVVFDDSKEFHDEDFTAKPRLVVTLDAPSDVDLSNNSDEQNLPFRTGVGCMVRAHTLEKIEEDMGITVERCTEGEKPFEDVRHYNPYCGVIKEGEALGIVKGSADWKDVDSDGDLAEIVMDPFSCANHADGSIMVARAFDLALPPADFPCVDVPEASTEEYRDEINAVQLATGALADADGNCKPGDDLLRPTLEKILEAL
jgi:hypothetical protein